MPSVVNQIEPLPRRALTAPHRGEQGWAIGRVRRQFDESLRVQSGGALITAGVVLCAGAWFRRAKYVRHSKLGM